MLLFTIGGLIELANNPRVLDRHIQGHQKRRELPIPARPWRHQHLCSGREMVGDPRHLPYGCRADDPVFLRLTALNGNRCLRSSQ